MTTLVCDIDNTIADARARLARSLEEIGRPELVPTAFNDYGGFEPFVSKAEHRRLFRIFLSERFIDLDTPMPQAADVLNDWIGRGLRLVYLTGRHDGSGDAMRAGTETWLRQHGFPGPDMDRVELYMKPQRGLADTAYKRDALSAICERERPLAGIGDLPYEGQLYGEFGLRPILTAELGLIAEDDLAASHPSAIVVRSWADIAHELRP